MKNTNASRNKQQTDDNIDELRKTITELTKALDIAKDSAFTQSYKAGMAEMALGVLHNIGNAITPAKVCTSMLLKKLSDSPIKNHLAPTLLPLESVIEESSLTEADKAKFKMILKILPTSIDEEYQAIINEVEKIRLKQSHIESIITLQMRYSHFIETATMIDLHRLANDALLMLDESLGKRDVSITKEYGSVPMIVAEESRLLQILINIIKNAYEALEQTLGNERQLIIRIYQEHSDIDYACISIQDTGIGFDTKQQAQLFTFGYTSKEDGCGFGLHSSTHYIQSIDGKMEAESSGLGKGAKFTIKLPVLVKD
ncbi:MAG: HAMP domain-containing histidine kinase [Methylococcales bacterium]|jgi:signal transduction histidine kinase|nr:HAMP domain-containing histidine kinase [Methylococcales bacterium]